MMCCNKCQLNPKKCFSEPQSLFSLRARSINLLKCKGQYCEAFKTQKSNGSSCGDCPQKYRLEICPQDAWVLAFLPSGDRFACETACFTLDTLVSTGNSELLTELFKAANYDIRKELWFRMVDHYRDRMYLLDEIFERDELPPASALKGIKQYEKYQYSILKNVAL